MNLINKMRLLNQMWLPKNQSQLVRLEGIVYISISWKLDIHCIDIKIRKYRLNKSFQYFICYFRCLNIAEVSYLNECSCCCVYLTPTECLLPYVTYQMSYLTFIEFCSLILYFFIVVILTCWNNKKLIR